MKNCNILKRKTDNKRQKGASLVEYALLVALIAVVCIAAITLVGTAASQKFSAIGSHITAS